MNDARSARLPVIVNAGSGVRGTDVARRVRASLADAAVDASLVVCGPHELVASLQAAHGAGPVMLGVAGGDGTMRTAAQVLVDGSTILAPFAAGTLNHFTQRLQLRSAHDTAEAAAAARVQTIAVGRVDDDVFLNTATFGLYADVLRRRERLRRWMGKWPAAAVAFLVTIVRLRPVHLVLDTAGNSIQRDTALVWIGMGRGSFPIVHQAEERRAAPDLEVAVLRDVGRGRLFAFGMRTFWRALRRDTPVRDDALEFLHVRTVTVESRRGRVGVTLDGEVMRRRARAQVRVEDAALRVLVGAGFSAPPEAAQLPGRDRRATVK